MKLFGTNKPIKMCSVEECKRTHKAKGLCHYHYDKALYSTQAIELRRASHNRCLPRKWDRYFGWEAGWCEWILAVQPTCGICGKPFEASKNLSRSIDHNHETGEFRGVLHNSCNMAIGILGDNIVGLEEAIAYLKQ